MIGAIVATIPSGSAAGSMSVAPDEAASFAALFETMQPCSGTLVAAPLPDAPLAMVPPSFIGPVTAPASAEPVAPFRSAQPPSAIPGPEAPSIAPADDGTGSAEATLDSVPLCARDEPLAHAPTSATVFEGPLAASPQLRAAAPDGATTGRAPKPSRAEAFAADTFPARARDERTKLLLAERVSPLSPTSLLVGTDASAPSPMLTPSGLDGAPQVEAGKADGPPQVEAGKADGAAPTMPPPSSNASSPLPLQSPLSTVLPAVAQPSLASALAAHRFESALGFVPDRDWARTFDAGGAARVEARAQTLGPVTIEVARATDGLAITLRSATEDARVVLADAQPRLVADARAAGLVLSQSRVDDAPHREPGREHGRERRGRQHGLTKLDQTGAAASASTADRFA